MKWYEIAEQLEKELYAGSQLEKLIKKVLKEMEEEKAGKKDPRTGKLCKVWDGNEEPSNEEARYRFINEIDHSKGWPFINLAIDCCYEHARLLTDEEKARYL